MANKARVTYVDGTTETVNLRPKATIAAERKYGAAAQGDRQVEASMYMIWYALGMPGGSDGFTAWLDKLDEVGEVDDSPEDAPGDGAGDPPEPASSEPFPT